MSSAFFVRPTGWGLLFSRAVIATPGELAAAVVLSALFGAFAEAGAVRGVGLKPDRTTVLMAEEAGRLRVVVAYDVSDSPLMLMGGMLPRPPAVIRRVAVIQVGDLS